MEFYKDLTFGPEISKEEVCSAIEAHLGSVALRINEVNKDKPWGAYFVIDDADTDRFIQTYYPGYDIRKITQYGDKLSLKILAAAPGALLSWQFHYRRAELWRGLAGPAGYYKSPTDEQGELHILENGEIVQYDPEERHRLAGLENWGIVAEFWQHTDPVHLSNEEDIVRLDDQYGRAA